MADDTPKAAPARRPPPEKADTAAPVVRVHRREFRLPTGQGMASGAPVVETEALALGLRPCGEASIESDTDDGTHHVIVWVVPVEDNVR